MLRSFLAASLVIGASLAVMPDAMAQGLVPCAPENGFCRVPYPTRVIYGVPGRSAAREVAGRGIPCSNNVFGDPAPGIPKRCAYVARGYGRGDDGWRGRDEEPGWGYDGPRRGPYGPGQGDGMAAWQRCAREGGFCDFRGTRRVRYGAAGRFAERVSRDGTPCNNGVFGDPAPGIPKSCQVLD
jgi:hypothetical protein